MEMLLVLAIIALLIGMGTVMMKDVLGDAESGRAQGDIAGLSASIVRYKTMASVYPTTAQGLRALYERPTVGPPPKRWKQLIKEEALYDPWQQEYQYRYPGTNDTYDIFSLGPDGEAGTEDDVTSW